MNPCTQTGTNMLDWTEPAAGMATGLQREVLEPPFVDVQLRNALSFSAVFEETRQRFSNMPLFSWSQKSPCPFYVTALITVTVSVFPP